MKLACVFTLVCATNAFVAERSSSRLPAVASYATTLRGGDIFGKAQDKASEGKSRAENQADRASNSLQDGWRRTENTARDTARNVEGKTKKAKRTLENMPAEQAIPLLSAVPGAFLGLQLLFNPENAAKFIGMEDTKGALIELSDNQRSLASWAGAGILLANIAVAGCATHGSHDNIKLANTLALASSVVTEGVQQWTVNRQGRQPIAQGFQGVFTVIRGVVTVASVWALASLTGNVDN